MMELITPQFPEGVLEQRKLFLDRRKMKEQGQRIKRVLLVLVLLSNTIEYLVAQSMVERDYTVENRTNFQVCINYELSDKSGAVIHKLVCIPANSETLPGTWSLNNSPDIDTRTKNTDLNPRNLLQQDREVTDFSKSVFPNPFIDKFKFTLKDAAEIELFDSNGRRVMTKHVEAGIIQIGMDMLNGGIYILKVSSGTYTGIVRLIKE